jgi:hypothetical protein
MARGSGSGSYRQWAAEERAAERAREQAAKKAEAERKAGERERAAAASAARDEDALLKSAALDQRIIELETLLLSSPHTRSSDQLHLSQTQCHHPAVEPGPARESDTHATVG